MAIFLLFLFHLLFTSNAQTEATIECGVPITGTREAGVTTFYHFISDQSYSLIFLEGCDSLHDIWLFLENGDRIPIHDADDAFNHGDQRNCGHAFAGDITVPDNLLPVEEGVSLLFGVGGFGDSAGQYTIELFCTPNQPSPTNQPTPPTNQPSSSTEFLKITCGQKITGLRSPSEEVMIAWTSDNQYTEVFLEGCLSTHDIWLSVYNEQRQVLSSHDDQNNHPNTEQCGHQFAGDITIPDNELPIDLGDIYWFGVSGFGSSEGTYTVELVCTPSDTNPQPTESPSVPSLYPTPNPTPNPTAQDPTPPSVPTSPTTICNRHREAWHLISQEKRNLYINGIKALADNGRLALFTETHAAFESSRQAHNTGAFLPWHRYFIWELETQIRNLGTEFRCFALPYWDWSSEVERFGFRFRDYDILNSGLGGAGDPDDDHCVLDGPFRRGEYTPSSCFNTQCCLVRDSCGNDESSCQLKNPSEMMETITDWSFYGTDTNFGGTDRGYREELESDPHGWAHVMIGGNGHLGDVEDSPDDPIFYLLHSFIDFNWALWQDCYDYDQVNSDDITTEIYDGNLQATDEQSNFGPSAIDDELIVTQMEEAGWALASTRSITMRDMHSLEDWDVTYDIGSFFNDARVLDNQQCSNINPNWFKDITLRRRTRRRRNLLHGEYISDYARYSNDTFMKLKIGIESKYNTIKGNYNRELYKTWSEMNCNYLQLGNKCRRPRYFDDCSNMELSNNGYNGLYDIDITLYDLIKKVEDYPCMIGMRKKMFHWARDSGNLYRLCRGDYDRFCDKDFIYQNIENICLSKQESRNLRQQKKRNQQEKDKEKKI